MINKLSKVLKNKQKKEKSLYAAAYELFTTKGIHNTAISDIAKKAGVAKGTFYLYFKDKYDILDRIILRKSSSVLKEAIKATKEQEITDFVDQVIFFIDFIIEYLKDNKVLLKLIYKNLSWGLYRRALADTSGYNEMKEIFNSFMESMKDEKYDSENPEKTLFMIIELTGSVCYSSIILEEPTTIDEMKPILFKTIRKMIQK
ncbi:TetR/AcrR family transcriptional regulator [Caloranaerobacter azorensis]|uniref:TetR family transcriptional regulator n=2 Tax=Caloranaerobacter azorensis TaxID=116090 RepID=A0A096CWK6_9FIRM|nr:TetR/AcrR family transcriptional regulator [Caloranaerobacter azorensis]KGG80954.1 TetR family transcriptional regulator [Caloranaerobacter azorensis H53214]QIB27553.1 TetR/AcrR family transcriptional regulator [Caloranaerobacter azorensis]